MADREREFLDYYNEHRIKDQESYYLSKSGWHERRANFFILAAGIVMFLASAASWAVSNGVDPPALWGIVATVMPAVSGAIVAIRALYEFDRTHTRFRNTYFDLRHAAVELRPAEKLAGQELRDATLKYVTEIENLLSRENSQWVNMMSKADPSSPAGPAPGRNE